MAKLLDADARTAWCEGTKGDGVGEWVEVRFHKHSFPPDFHKVVFVPGYAKSQWSYRANGRVKRVRVSTCRDPKVGADYELPLAGRFDRSLLVLELDESLRPRFKSEISGYRYRRSEFEDPYGNERDQQTAKSLPWKKGSRAPCLRFTILEVDRGRRYRDTCISEIAGLDISRSGAGSSKPARVWSKTRRPSASGRERANSR